MGLSAKVANPQSGCKKAVGAKKGNGPLDLHYHIVNGLRFWTLLIYDADAYPGVIRRASQNDDG